MIDVDPQGAFALSIDMCKLGRVGLREVDFKNCARLGWFGLKISLNYCSFGRFDAFVKLKCLGVGWCCPHSATIFGVRKARVDLRAGLCLKTSVLMLFRSGVVFGALDIWVSINVEVAVPVQSTPVLGDEECCL